MRDLTHVIRPVWPARGVAGLASTAMLGDVAMPAGRAALRALLPGEPRWLRQVHGSHVVDLDRTEGVATADAAIARAPGAVCIVQTADCLPVLLADEDAAVVAAAHAGWRGLARGVLEATVDAMRVPGSKLFAWLGPAIGPGVYEVGEDVRAAIATPADAFRPNRPGHWLLDLYAVARDRLKAKGVERIYGGGFCTHSDRQHGAPRFFSYRRDRGNSRMAAAIWIT